MKVLVAHWMNDGPAMEKANVETGEQEMSGERILWLSQHFDVMIAHREHCPVLWLDAKGKGFRQR